MNVHNVSKNVPACFSMAPFTLRHMSTHIYARSKYRRCRGHADFVGAHVSECFHTRTRAPTNRSASWFEITITVRIFGVPPALLESLACIITLSYPYTNPTQLTPFERLAKNFHRFSQYPNDLWHQKARVHVHHRCLLYLAVLVELRLSMDRHTMMIAIWC